MKKTFCIILCILCISISYAQVIVYPGYRVVYPVYRIYRPAYKIVYKEVKQEKLVEQIKQGAICIQAHCSYNFNDALYANTLPQIEFGGSLSYYFKANPSYGLIAGYDHGFNQWWNHPAQGIVKYETQYWDIRIGACISKYFSLGMTYGQYNNIYDYSRDIYFNGDDFGVFTNINIPFIPEFGIFIDGKWTRYQGFSLGGGILIKIFTK